MSSRRRLRLAWLVGMVSALVASPNPASAARTLTRRSLPRGAVPAAAPVQTQARGDSIVEGDIQGLLRSVGVGRPPSSAELARGDGTYLARSTGGYVRSLVAPAGRAWIVSPPGGDTSPGGLALTFLREHQAALGWARRGADLRVSATRSSSDRSYVRFEQDFDGLPVFGAAVVVQVEANGAVAFVLSDIARDDAGMHAPDFTTEPTLDGGSAVAAALGVVPAAFRVGLDADVPVLMVYEPSVIGSAGPSRLVWHVRVRNEAGDVNQVVLVDAGSGEIAFSYSDVKRAKDRSIYDAANVPGSLGTLVRTEGGPASGIVDADLAYQYLGDTYDFYFSRFARDSFDGAGAALIGRVRYCEPSGTCPYPNAYWNGSELRFGAGYASADDVVAHELTHAVTDRESNLIYWGESGAINEALSDIFGEFVDLTNAGGTDGPSVRWLVGEDLPGGAIRSMADPTLYGDPDRRFSGFWYTGSEDNRGVHFNSGVANKLAFLLTDGGSFNGQPVGGQGIGAVASLFYEVQTNLLVPASDYFDLYAALKQAARNRGWTSPARDALEAASRAVEIDLPGNPVTVLTDGFEGTFPGVWQVFDQGGPPPSYPGTGAQWGRSTYRKASGSASAWCAAGGSSPSPPGGPYKPLMDTWLVYGPFSLASTTQAWAEFDTFLDVDPGFDEVFWGVSTDGVVFDGYAVSPIPDGYSVGEGGAVPGWSHELFNFKEVPGVLGKSQVWLAFQFVSDDIDEYEGAYLDNVVLRKAPTAAPFGSFDSPANGTGGLSGSVALQGWALDDYGVTKIEIYRNPITGETPGPNGKVYVGDAVQVAGLRPDVEALYPDYPYAYKAGWTYNLRSNFLPSNGNGTFTFFAYGYDADGRSSQLGSSRTLSFVNSTAGLGTPVITAPLEGQTIGVSGVGFAWTGVGGADRYDLRLWRQKTAEVVFSGSILGASSTSTILSLPQGLYQFSVRACSGGTADGQCGRFALVDFGVSLISPTGAPTITDPTGGASLTSSTHTFQWTAVTPNPALSGMTYEVVLRNVEAGTTALQINVPAPTTSTVFTMASSDYYELKVRACQAGCGPWSTPVAFSVTLPPVPTSPPTITGCTVTSGNSLTCTWNLVPNADAYQVQVVQPPPAGPGGGALTVAAKQVSSSPVTLPVPAGDAGVYISACTGDGCGPYGTSTISVPGPNPSQPNVGTPMAGTVVSGPGVLLTWNRVPGDDSTNTWYRLYVQDLSRQAAALDVYTRNNFYSAYFKAEGARYDALVVANPGLPSEVVGPAQGFNISGASATAPTLVSPPHNSTVTQGNIDLGWSPIPGATLYEYFVAVLGQSNATVRGVTPGLLARVPLTASGSGTTYSGIVRACPAGATCAPGSDTGWGPWSNAAGGPGVVNFTVTP